MLKKVCTDLLLRSGERRVFILDFIFDEFVVSSAKDMVSIAFKKYQSKQLEDVAYFEPYYLKDFVLQQKKKKN